MEWLSSPREQMIPNWLPWRQTMSHIRCKNKGGVLTSADIV